MIPQLSMLSLAPGPCVALRMIVNINRMVININILLINILHINIIIALIISHDVFCHYHCTCQNGSWWEEQAQKSWSRSNVKASWEPDVYHDGDDDDKGEQNYVGSYVPTSE